MIKYMLKMLNSSKDKDVLDVRKEKKISCFGGKTF